MIRINRLFRTLAKIQVRCCTSSTAEATVPITPLVPPSIVSNPRGSKVVPSCEQAIEESPLKSGDTLCIGGFGICGAPIGLLHTIAAQPSKYNNLTLISNNPGIQDWGNGKLIHNKQVKKMILSYARNNPEFSELYFKGEIQVEWIPQGTLSEKMRAGGAGIPAFYTRTGYGTWIQEGKMPIQFEHPSDDKPSENKILQYSQPKQVSTFNGKEYILEEALTGDIGLVKASECDEFGNCRFHYTARNFNPEAATASKYTIVEAEKIVPMGSIPPEDVHLPGAYVNAIVECTTEKKIEVLIFSDETDESSNEQQTVDNSAQITINTNTTKIKPHKQHKDIITRLKESGNIKDIKRNRIAKRASFELHNNMLVNLGIGIPTLIPNFLNFDEMKLWFHTENGLLGVGSYPQHGKQDPDLINAGEEVVTYIQGASMFSSSDSFKLVRGKHLHLSILGSMQISQYGDISNWLNTNDHFIKGMGGGMDLVNSGMPIIGCITHTTKSGEPKIVNQCSLPLTGKQCCNRIITDLAVFDVDFKNGLTLIELLDNATLEEVKDKTEPSFQVSPNLKYVDVLGF